MRRRSVFAAPVLAFATRAAASGDARLERLYATFMAPCCWRENLLAHKSPAADELRAQIRALVHAGKSDAEIRSMLVKQHSGRILAMPDGAPGAWLRWTPAGFAMAGLGLVSWVIRSSLGRAAGRIEEIDDAGGDSQ